MALGPLGKLAAADISFYIPVFCVAFITTLRHGFRRQEGWIYLFLFCLIRIAGGAITIASETSSTSQTGLTVAAVILSGVGLSPLQLATRGFIAKIAQNALPLSQRPLQLTRLLIVTALVLGVVGGTSTSPGNSPSTISTGRTLIRASTGLFMGSFIVLFGLHIMLWRERHHLQIHHRNLLAGVSLALPALFVRLVYALLGAFASSMTSRWSPFFGDWRIYLTMSLIMEYWVTVTYVVVGFLIPVQKDEEGRRKVEPYEMNRMPLQEGVLAVS